MEQKIPDPGPVSGKSGVSCYAAELNQLLCDLEKKYGYSELDSFLVLKDILASVWKCGKSK